MRVAVITVHGCPLRQAGSKDSGGMNIYILEMVKRMAARGIQVDVFTRHHDPLDPEVVTLSPGARLIHLPSGPPSIDKTGLYDLLPEFSSQMRRFCVDNRLSYEIVNTHYWLSGLVGIRLASEWGVPHITSFHTMAVLKQLSRPEEKEVPQRYSSEIELASAADSIVVWTQNEKDSIVKHTGINGSKIRIIPPGVDLGRFRPMSKIQARAHLGYGSQKNILFVGRLEPLKGLDRLFKAISSLKNSSSVIVNVVGGDENSQEKTRLIAIAEQMNIAKSVRFVGSVGQNELPYHYNAADICVLPSYYESFGLAALEASACGRPVVASDVGGLPTIVSNGISGFLVPPNSIDLMAEKLCDLLENDLLRHRMGVAARRSSESFSWDRSVDSLLESYWDLVPKPKLSASSLAGG